MDPGAQCVYVHVLLLRPRIDYSRWAMALCSSTRSCRLCQDLVASNRAVSLYSATGIQQQWASRIESLLDVPVSNHHGLSGYICQKCKIRLVSLEKAAADLNAFKQLANCSRSAVERVRGPLKRPECTSSDTGVSPDTARDRSRSKLPKKRLDFNSEIQTLHFCIENIYRTEFILQALLLPRQWVVIIKAAPCNGSWFTNTTNT